MLRITTRSLCSRRIIQACHHQRHRQRSLAVLSHLSFHERPHNLQQETNVTFAYTRTTQFSFSSNPAPQDSSPSATSPSLDDKNTSNHVSIRLNDKQLMETRDEDGALALVVNSATETSDSNGTSSATTEESISTSAPASAENTEPDLVVSESGTDQNERTEVANNEHEEPIRLSFRVNPTWHENQANKPVVWKGKLEGLLQELNRSIKEEKVGAALQNFNDLMLAKYADFDTDTYQALFDLLLKKRNIRGAFQVLKRWMQDDNGPGIVNMEQWLRVLGRVNYSKTMVQAVEEMVLEFANILAKLDKETYQYHLFPRLLLNISQQASSQIGKLNNKFYQYTVKNNFPLQPFIAKLTLACAKYHRRDELPFVEIFERLIKEGHNVEPEIVIHLLEVCFPFEDDSVKILMEGILELEKKHAGSDGVHYRVDMGTLEAIAAAASRRGNYSTVLAVWDLVESLQYRPTESLYESAIQAFLQADYKDHNAFQVLAEMEKDGFTPSRALVRSISTLLKSHVKRLDHSYYLLTEPAPGTKATTASLNCILSACAENGQVDHAFGTFADFPKYNAPYNGDTFSFLMESLAEHICSTVPIKPETIIDVARRYGVETQVTAAGTVKEMMEEEGIEMTRHLLHHYVRLLCAVLDMGEAQSLLDRYSTYAMDQTVAMLAIAYGRVGAFEQARQVGAPLKAKMPWVMKRIKKLENMHKRQEAQKQMNGAILGIASETEEDKEESATGDVDEDYSEK